MLDADENAADGYIWGTKAGDRLGTSLATGDLDGDGCAEILAGAEGWDGRTALLALSLCEYGAFAPDSHLLAEDLAMGIFTAPPSWRVGASSTQLPPADIDGDGLLDLVIAAPGSAAVFVFPHGGAAWGTVALDRITDSDAWVITGAGTTRFAEAVATGSDLDGDGREEVVVGAPGVHVATDAGETLFCAGAVYVFDPAGSLPSGTLTEADAEAVFFGEHDGDELGSGLAAGGDLNADGLEDLVLGARGWSDTTGGYCGAVLGLLGWKP